MSSVHMLRLVTRGAVATAACPSTGLDATPAGGARMTDRQPSEVTNLDRYGDRVLPWRRPHDLLASGPKGPLAGFFLGTVRLDRAAARRRDQRDVARWRPLFYHRARNSQGTEPGIECGL